MNDSTLNAALKSHCKLMSEKSHQRRPTGPDFISKYKEITKSKSDKTARLAELVLYKAEKVPATCLLSRKALASIGEYKISPAVMDFISDPQVMPFLESWNEKGKFADILKAYNDTYLAPPMKATATVLGLMMTHKEGWGWFSNLVQLQVQETEQRNFDLGKGIALSLLVAGVSRIISPDVISLFYSPLSIPSLVFLFCVCVILVLVPTRFGVFDKEYKPKV